MIHKKQNEIIDEYDSGYVDGFDMGFEMGRRAMFSKMRDCMESVK